MSGNLELNGEAWRDRELKTYTAITDMYGASALFSEKVTNQYLEHQEAQSMDPELTKFLFSGQMQDSNAMDAELANYVFSEELKLTRVRNYNQDTESHLQVFLLSSILGVLLFSVAIFKYNQYRRKRRAAYATEIDMENRGWGY